MNDNGNIRLLTPENDMRVRAFLSSLEELSEKVEKIRKNNKPSLDGEHYYTDKELAVKLKVSRRSLQDYRNNGNSNKFFQISSAVRLFIKVYAPART